ncbi:bacteriohemerythrin [Labilibacter marinus]|uniref:bacteriohemerythrin n=1 Tax=Labilibacter marinus TaxID=1477105 RepID=UPI00082FA6C7|nr:bacteriohemerythrin [Labilibacter marinus]
MALIEWSDKFELGIVSIDKQHKTLVDIINRFHVLIQQGSSHEEITQLLIEMKQYTINHFSNEEDFLLKYNFEHLEEHQLEHKKFIHKITDLEHQHKHSQIVLTLEITKFLKSWLIHHIQGTDRRYLKLFKDNGMI